MAIQTTVTYPPGTDAPVDATYVTNTSNATLTGEQALSSLSTGLLKVTTGTGTLSTAAASDIPTHASRHQNGGADEIATATPAANAIPKADGTGKLDSGWLPSSGAPTDATYIVQTANGSLSAEQALSSLSTGLVKVTNGTGVLSTAANTDLPTHASLHNAGGSDAMAIDAAAGTGSLRTIGTSATSACAGNDSRLATPSNATATPTASKIPIADGAGKLDAGWLPSSVAPSDATYICQTANGSLSAEQALSSLSTGLVKVTNGTGVLSTAAVTDVPVFSGLTETTNPNPFDDYAVIYDGSGAANAKVLQRNMLVELTNSYFDKEDFTASMAASASILGGYKFGLAWVITNSGFATQVASTSGHTGIVQLQLGLNNINETAQLYSLNQSAFLFSGGRVRLAWLIKTPANLSDANDPYTLRVGFGDAATAGDGTDGLFFRYTHSANSGKWLLVARNNSTETTQDTAITVAINTWYLMEIEVNAAGNSAQAHINRSPAGSPCTTNIPTSTGRETGLMVSAARGGALTSNDIKLQIDAVALWQEFSTARY